MKELSFYDLRKKKKFNAKKYEFLSKTNPKTKRKVYMARTKSPWGNECYRIVSQEEYKK